MVQWIRIRLPVQGAWVRSLVLEDSTCLGATKLMGHNYWAHPPKPVLHKRSHHSEKTMMATESTLRLLKLEKALMQQQRPRTTKNKINLEKPHLKSTFIETYRIMFDQISGCCGLAKLTRKNNHYISIYINPCFWNFFPSPIKKYLLFIYLAVPALSCSMKDLVPWTGIALGPPALEGQSFDHWTTRKLPFFLSPKIAILPIVLLIVPHRLESQAGWSASSLPLAVYLLTLSLPSGNLTCSGEACTISALWLIGSVLTSWDSLSWCQSLPLCLIPCPHL